MHQRRFKRLFHSVFTKLLVTILLAGTAITLAVVIGFAIVRIHSISNLDRNLLLYAEYLATDLGDPPDFDRAAEISRRTGFTIRFDHPDHPWQTGKIPASLKLDRAWMRKHDNGIWTGHRRGLFFIRQPHAGGELIFIAPSRAKDHDEAGLVFVFMGIVLLAVLGAAYFFIRRILKPLRVMQSGVEALAEGRLDHRVAETGNDEFRALAEAFNTMAKRLSELLTGKERLLLDISHELRSPLTRMKVQLEFLADKEAREALRTDVEEMESMVTAILEEARLRNSIAALNLEKVDVVALIQSVIEEFKDRPPGIDCEMLTPAFVRADRDKLRLVLRNLLDNAMKYTPEDGESVTVSVTIKTDNAYITIEDRGEGIPDTALPFLFEPFFRADASRSRKTGGFGLGLSLCKTVVDAHKGRIEVTSTPGEGTRVVVILPSFNDTPDG